MSKYIPEILKDKFQSFTRYLYVCIYGLVAINLGLSIFSFNINDNSFLTSSSQPTSNFLGPIGAHISSFFLLLLIGSLVSSMSKEGVEKFFKFLSFESVF